MYDIYPITGVDPGTNYIGVTTIYIRSDFSIDRIDSFTINISREQPHMVNEILDYKLLSLRDKMNKYFNTINPIAVSIEKPFMYMKRPTSIIPLAMCLDVLVSTSLQYNPTMFINRVSPSEVKNAINAKGNAKKDDMLLALSNHFELSQYVNVNYMSEHEIDSTAIAYSLLQKIRNNYLILYL